MERKQVFQGGYLPLETINVIVQPRKTFEEIQELADNIAENGILNPPVVVILSDEECVDYLGTVNSVWKTDYSKQDLIKYQESYCILIAGERRFRGYKVLFEKGCTSCREENDKIEYGKCFEKHFHRKTVEVRVCSGLRPMDALYLQLAENTHFRVPPQEEAHAYQTVFSAEKRMNPKFSLAKFARRVGRCPDTIRKSLRYCELPQFVQDEVEKGGLKYGFAVELCRLQDNGVDEESLRFWLYRAMLSRKDLKHFHKRIDAFLFDLNSGQTSLPFDLENPYTLNNLKRRVVSPEITKGAHEFISYFQLLDVMFKEGKLGKKDSLFSEGSPNRVYKKVVELLPFFKETLSKPEYKKVEDALSGVLENKELILCE